MTDIDTPKFSRLEKVPLRQYFPNEASDFTPWLEANLEELGNVLGLNLEPILREAPVGDLSLDLLAKDVDNSKTVIIENQLEKAEHKHLGQLLAYAAGRDAKIVVWISHEFRDEYRQVLEWLNQQTNSEIHFFAVVVEVLKIEDSNPALNFKLVVSPNQWKKSIQPSEETETQRRYRNFFQKLIDELRENRQFTNARAAQPNTWYYFSSRHQGFTYCVRFRQGTQVIVYVRIYEGDNENRLALFDTLANEEAAITEVFGSKFDWKRNPELQESQIIFERDGYVDWDTDDIDEIHKWCVTHLLKLKEVFDPKIKQALENIMKGE